MATQTYQQIQKQIEELRAQAAQLRDQEIAVAVSKVKELVAKFGLSVADIFGSASAAAPAKTGNARRRRGQSYADAAGNTWSGFGPRPRWLREAIAGGKSLEDFSAKPVAAEGKGSAGAKSAGKRKDTAPKRGGKVRFSDGAGNKWSGFGPKPGWLREAIASGKKLEDFRV